MFPVVACPQKVPQKIKKVRQIVPITLSYYISFLKVDV